MPFRAKFIAIISPFLIFGGLFFGASAQESGSLYYLPGIPQTSKENPAFQSQAGKLVIGIPFLSGVSAQWNSSVPLNSLFSKGFSYSFHRFYDALDETGHFQSSAGAAVFFVSLKRNEYSFNFSVSERAFSEGIFDREIVRLIRDGTEVFFGKEENLGDATFYLTHYREVAAGVSKQLWKGMNIGIRPKVLFGKFYFEGEDLNLSVRTDAAAARLLVQPEGSFTLAGPLIHVRDTLRKSSSFYADFSPGDYFFQPKNMGVALDMGVVFQPNNFSEVSFSLVDIGVVEFEHKTYNARFKRPAIYSPEKTYQSHDPAGNNYLEPREAIIAFADSVAFLTDVEKSDSHNFSSLPFKINLAGKYIFSEKLTAGFSNQFKYYRVQPLNLFSVFATATLDPRFAFFGSLTLLNTQSLLPGFGASYTNNLLQIYFTSNNISGIIQPMAPKQLNLSFGINLLIDIQ
ncbi:hypothetical protein SAMN05444274_105281 [Mariniphaga anaerophila]|uniref:DUF5723 domain-containing protein n=1 Tax=Mariniphaga anaerophila TaxID=1484053 RepID=A0A1M5BSI5_9BACT|nr:DUF5723 family protein [Mariniphaga anaerophila]SHF45321.1 hypothetical protein SAMN05444274_105281 [Mariniphaga anaerophila]